MKNIFQSSILVLLFLSVGHGSYAQYTMKDFQPLQRLAGSWKMITKKGALYEHWYRVNDSVLQNKSYRVNGPDTIPQEMVKLIIANGIITYTSTVANQNNQQPVTFTLVKMDAGRYIFENMVHDFPQQISYQLTDKNTLRASISGTVKDKYSEVPFHFKREE